MPFTPENNLFGFNYFYEAGTSQKIDLYIRGTSSGYGDPDEQYDLDVDDYEPTFNFVWHESYRSDTFETTYADSEENISVEESTLPQSTEINVGDLSSFRMSV